MTPATPHRAATKGVVVIVDDEPRIVRLLAEYLNDAGFRTIEAFDGRTAVTAVAEHDPDVVILDLGLPDLDGLDVLRTIRIRSMVPILILTARTDETDRIVGLELGADDYVTKPFGPKEVVARVRAMIRRADAATTADGDAMVVGGLEVDIEKRRVRIDGVSVALTATEFDILVMLARRPGAVLTRSQLLESVYGVSFDSYERAIDAHVKNIRRKIEPAVGSNRYVLTVHGVGYKLADE